LPPLVHARERDALARAFAAADAGRWDEAHKLAAAAGDRLGAKILRWLDLQRPRGPASFEDIAAFIDANPGWPAQDILNRRAEEALVARLDDSVVLAWFSTRAPATVDGAMRQLEALQRTGGDAQVPALVRDTWLRRRVRRAAGERVPSPLRSSAESRRPRAARRPHDLGRPLRRGAAHAAAARRRPAAAGRGPRQARDPGARRRRRAAARADGAAGGYRPAL
jgi:soluble lytic murein transglycosylase